VTPVDDSKPVELELDAAFGVCSDICIRAEANLALEVPHDLPKSVPAGIVQALEHTPRPEDKKVSGDPTLAAHEVVLTGKSPRVVLDVDFGSKPEKGDVFGLAPRGLYLPMAQRVEGQATKAGLQRFVIDLAQTIDLDDLKGKTITLTLVGADGQSEQKLHLQ